MTTSTLLLLTTFYGLGMPGAFFLGCYIEARSAAAEWPWWLFILFVGFWPVAAALLVVGCAIALIAIIIETLFE
jgi:hypothetical protein